MHKKEIKYVVNLTNKIIALDGRHVDKFGILYLGKKEIKQWNNIYNPLLRRGKIKLAKTHAEAISIMKENLSKSLISPALKRNATVVIDNEERKYNHNEKVRNFIVEGNNVEANNVTEGQSIEEEVYKGTEPVSEPENEDIKDEGSKESGSNISEGSADVEDVTYREDSEETNETQDETDDSKDAREDTPTEEVKDSAEEVEEEDTIEENEPIEENDVHEEESVDYSSMKVSELKAIAKEKGIENYTKLKKDDLVKALSGE